LGKAFSRLEEQLLPFNAKAEQLEAARAMPQLFFPEKKVVN
jgi:hypothetical protein